MGDGWLRFVEEEVGWRVAKDAERSIWMAIGWELSARPGPRADGGGIELGDRTCAEETLEDGVCAQSCVYTW